MEKWTHCGQDMAPVSFGKTGSLLRSLPSARQSKTGSSVSSKRSNLQREKRTKFRVFSRAPRGSRTGPTGLKKRTLFCQKNGSNFGRVIDRVSIENWIRRVQKTARFFGPLFGPRYLKVKAWSEKRSEKSGRCLNAVDTAFGTRGIEHRPKKLGPRH